MGIEIMDNKNTEKKVKKNRDLAGKYTDAELKDLIQSATPDEKTETQYIVIFDLSSQEEVYYCDTLARVKEKIEYMTLSKDEKQKVRVFEVENEIDVHGLFLHDEVEEVFNAYDETLESLSQKSQPKINEGRKKAREENIARVKAEIEKIRKDGLKKPRSDK